MPKMCFLGPSSSRRNKSSSSRKYITDPFSKITYPVSSPHSSSPRQRPIIINASPIWAIPDEVAWERPYSPPPVFISPQSRPHQTSGYYSPAPYEDTRPRYEDRTHREREIQSHRAQILEEIEYHQLVSSKFYPPAPKEDKFATLEKSLKEGLGKLDKKFEERERKEELMLAEKKGRDAARREGEERERWGRVEMGGMRGGEGNKGGYMLESGRGGSGGGGGFGMESGGGDTARRLGRLEDVILWERERERDMRWVEERERVERRGGSSYDDCPPFVRR